MMSRLRLLFGLGALAAGVLWRKQRKKEAIEAEQDQMVQAFRSRLRPHLPTSEEPAVFLYSCNSTLYHAPDCPFIRRIKQSNLNSVSTPPFGLQPHRACIEAKKDSRSLGPV
jgi:hypothetical protein